MIRAGAMLAIALLVAEPAIAQSSASPPASPPAARPAPAVTPPRPIDAVVAAWQAGRHAEARRLAEPLALAGDGQAATVLGLLHERGLGGAKDAVAAVGWYRRGVAARNPDAMVGLGRMGVAGAGGATPGEAFGVLQRALAAGRTEAASSLADLYLSGAAGPRDRTMAADLYGRAARAGDAAAAYAAAILLDDGEPDPADDATAAAAFLKQAAEAGRKDAAADYGLLLHQGRGVAQDRPGAARWFKIAAEGGDPDGAFYWALVNARGDGVARDLPTALRFARLARGTSPEADRLLAQLERAATGATPAHSRPPAAKAARPGS
jgi:TPR repeat protein